MDIKQFYLEAKGNYNEALSRMMNDVLIVRMLNKFMGDNCINNLISSYENKDYRTVFSTSHTLKGVAGNLSLTSLFEIASTITEATRNDDGVNLDKEIAELKEAYATIQNSFSKYLTA